MLSTIALLILSHVSLCIALLVKRTPPGPILYRGVRTGLHGRPFKILKFRTMVPDAGHLGGPSTALNDPRLTPIGKLLRKYKLDELPQLLNILKGEMSFVGPRPQVDLYTCRYNHEEKAILAVRPGLTDWATLKYINLDEILGDRNVDEKYQHKIEPEKNRLRVLYARNCSFSMDLRILVATVMQLVGIGTTWSIEG